MPSSKPEESVDKLVERIKTRTYASGETSFTLDLRGKKWGNYGQKTIRVYGHPDWPEEGVPAMSLHEARAQLKHYADWLNDQTSEAPSRRRTVVTWSEAVPAYLESLKAKKGVEHGTYKAHRGPLENHVLPKWKDRPLTLSTKEVGDWLAQIRVTKKVDDQHVQAAAAANTKRVIYTAMRACWVHHFGGHSSPSFGGIKIKSDDDSVKRRADAEKGVIREPRTKAYSPATVFEILVQAAINDYGGIRSLPKVWPRAVPNTPEAIAWQIGTLTRISELMFIRWHGSQGMQEVPMVDMERAGGVLYVPGIKSYNAPRWVVLWDALRPWVLRMQNVSLSSVDSTGFVFATPTSGTAEPAEGTYAGRIDKAIVAAGQKRPGKRTHILRSTGSTWLASRLNVNLVKTMMGHAAAHGGATDFYLDPHLLVLELPSDVRTYMDGLLPTPEVVYGEASERLRRQGHDVDLLAIEGNRYL